MSFNAKDMTQGGQIASMRIRMFSQIANIMLYCLFIFFWILVGLVLWVKISWQTFVNGCIYWWCTTLEGMRDLIKSQPGHCCKVSDEAAFCLIQRPYISKTLLT
nr:TraD N-terminal domain-containing protein [Escherichia coli]